MSSSRDEFQIPQMSAWIRYYFHVDPYSLSDEEFAIHWREASYLLRMMKPIKAD